MEHNYLLEYYEEIQNGKIVVGKELKVELDFLVSELNNHKFIFDPKPGLSRIRFIETFCKHTKSPFNGRPFILELWEKALLQTAYGFKYKETGLRRFNEVILLVARKNGKTTFIAGIDLAEFFLSSGGTDIVCASNTNDQASILFEEINNMREGSKTLRNEKYSKKNIFYIYSPKVEIDNSLHNLGKSFSDVQRVIQDKLDGLVVTEIDMNYADNINLSTWTNFEKILYLRETLNKKKKSEKKVFDEISNIIHLNDALQICLNPFEFNYYSKYVHDLLADL